MNIVDFVVEEAPGLVFEGVIVEGAFVKGAPFLVAEIEIGEGAACFVLKGTIVCSAPCLT